jgi:TRAP-type C4-dicarboxylate transport system permease small subunit
VSVKNNSTSSEQATAENASIFLEEGEFSDKSSLLIPTQSALVTENASIAISKIEGNRKQILFLASLVLIVMLLGLFAYGFCSYIGATKTMLGAEITKAAADKIISVAGSQTQSVLGNQQLHSPDWHFLLILAELLISMVLVFFITMKAVFPKAEDKTASIGGDVGESLKTLIDFAKSLWPKN